MGTRFFGEGNIGSDPTLKMFPGNGNQAPRGVLRLNVRFDNLVPGDDGMVDRGGFWANVEIWGRHVEQWASLYQRGQRVLVVGRMVQDAWEKDGEQQTAFKVQAERVGILPFRISQVVMEASTGQWQNNGQPPSSASSQAPSDQAVNQHQHQYQDQTAGQSAGQPGNAMGMEGGQ